MAAESSPTDFLFRKIKKKKKPIEDTPEKLDDALPDATIKQSFTDSFRQTLKQKIDKWDELMRQYEQQAVVHRVEKELKSNLRTIILRSEMAEILLDQETFDACQVEAKAEVARLTVDGAACRPNIGFYRHIIRNYVDPRVAHVLEDTFQGELRRLLIDQCELVDAGKDTKALRDCNMLLCKEWNETLNIFKLEHIVPYAVAVIDEWKNSKKREPSW